MNHIPSTTDHQLSDMSHTNQCYELRCNRPPKWSVQTESAIKNPDGSAVKLYACDEHCAILTKRCREVHRRYLMQPYNQVSCAAISQCSQTTEVDLERKIDRLPMLLRLVINGATIIVGVIIAPAIITYYLVRILFVGSDGKEK